MDAGGVGFDEQGWAVVRGAAGAALRGRLSAGFDRLMPPGCGPDVAQLLRPSLMDPAFGEWLEVAGRIAGEALGVGRVQLLQDALLFKPAGRGAGVVEWHRDWDYTGYLEAPRAVSVRLALGDEDAEAGGLEVVEGSHRWEMGESVETLFAERIGAGRLEALPAPYGERAREAVRPVALAAGDVSVHHALLLHGSGANRSGRDRRTIVVHLFDAELRLVPERLPSPEAAAWFTTDAAGRLTGPAFPVVWTRG